MEKEREHFVCYLLLLFEIWAAIRKMKLGKRTGPDSISVELLEPLEDYGIDKTTTLFNKTYDTCKIPRDISKSIFIALPKETIDNRV